MEANSDIHGLYNLKPDERVDKLKGAGLTEQDRAALLGGGLTMEVADRMIENVIGFFKLPLGVATNFRVNGLDRLIPMVIEEPSVVAAASNAAGIARAHGGFIAKADPPVMIGQLQIVDTADATESMKRVLKERQALIKECNALIPTLVDLGGGVRDIEARTIDTGRGRMLILHLLVDCRDAMGANTVNTIAETMTPRFVELTGGRARLRIISNYAVKRIARARGVFDRKLVGDDVIEGILDASDFAANDVYRAVTHNKGIMNGISAVALSLSNDTRAIEAGAHAYASRSGRYAPLTEWHKDGDGNLVGEIELPLAVATVGGAVNVNPISKIALKLLGVRTSVELAEVMAAVGLAQNFAALRALAAEGIQKGHMKLHARDLAVSAGAKPDEVDALARKLVETRVDFDNAKKLLEELRHTGSE
ncbi:MAG: hydroxymethylglutaryl-CoA reductase, degradative [Nitrososphaerota archaeon]|nr:hydroxymethylglutaryl-CoA reductase, degradative [Nitrososphaerota archaeon]MDG7043617.1 hydroxymethylglutaryl-CoA reductase, degradative [Nitrososphaerota archaeon]